MNDGFLVLGALIGGGVGGLVGAKRRQIPAGFIAGLFLGPIGWLIALYLPDPGPKCDECKGAVPDDASRCMHCGVLIAKKPSEPPADPRTINYANMVICPACNHHQFADPEQQKTGLRCGNCGVGFIPD